MARIIRLRASVLPQYWGGAGDDADRLPRARVRTPRSRPPGRRSIGRRRRSPCTCRRTSCPSRSAPPVAPPLESPARSFLPLPGGGMNGAEPMGTGRPRASPTLGRFGGFFRHSGRRARPGESGGRAITPARAEGRRHLVRHARGEECQRMPAPLNPSRRDNGTPRRSARGYSGRRRSARGAALRPGRDRSAGSRRACRSRGRRTPPSSSAPGPSG